MTIDAKNIRNLLIITYTNVGGGNIALSTCVDGYAYKYQNFIIYKQINT